ncbi:hypothetical protein IPJ91_02065 [bacterium]|nr:MAG: hypothetical protein IPJ91_02065 [bacterium]
MSKLLIPILTTPIVVLTILLPYFHNYLALYSLFLIVLTILIYHFVSVIGKKNVDMRSLLLFDKKGYIIQMTKHYLYPIIIVLVQISFVAIDYDRPFELIILTITSALHYLLLTNIFAYYDNKFQLEAKTHVVYDLVKSIIYFLLIYNLLHFYTLGFVNIIVFIASVFTVSTLALLSSIQRSSKESNKYTDLKLVSILAGLLIGIISLLLISFNLNMLAISILIFSTFYLMISILRHKLDESLTKRVIVEYISFELLLWGMIFLAR